MLMEHTTIKEVAGKARVSPATVSRILSGKYRRKSKTVEKVERIVEELRYARQQRDPVESPGPECVGVAMFAYRDFLNSYYNSTLSSSIMEALTAENYSAQLIALNPKRLNIEYLKSQILEHKLRGLLIAEFDILYSVSKELEALPIPVIGIGNLLNTLSHYVCSDSYRAGCDAANYLWSNGHRRFSVVTMALSDLCQKQRLAGFLDTVRGLGGDPEEVRVREFRSMDDSVSGWVSELVNMRERPDAVFCFNSLICRKLYAGMCQSGVRVPEDVSLLSFEEDGELEFLPTPISVLSQPTRRLGEVAVNMLMKSLSGIDVREREVLNCSLIIRKSVKNKE